MNHDNNHQTTDSSEKNWGLNDIANEYGYEAIQNAFGSFFSRVASRSQSSRQAINSIHVYRYARGSF